MDKDDSKAELVELRFEISGLAETSMDTQIRLVSDYNGHTFIVGETEWAPKGNTPVYKRAIRIDYRPNSVQSLKVQCFGKKAPQPLLIAEAIIDLNAVVEMGDEDCAVRLVTPQGQQAGLVHMDWVFIVNENTSFDMRIHCVNVLDIEIFVKSDPFVKILRPYDSHVTYTNKDEIPETMWYCVYQTEYKKGDLNPRFAPFNVSAWTLLKGNPEIILKVEIWDHCQNGKHQIIGTAFTTAARILNGSDKFVNTVTKKGKFAGAVSFDHFEEKRTYKVAEYMQSGIILRPFIAVDCSSSSKDFHKIGQDLPPDLYESAISEVAHILLKITGSEQFGFVGFNAKLFGCRHPCFSFNMNMNNPKVNSISEALEYYRKNLSAVEPYEPTSMAKLIEKIRCMIIYLNKYNKKQYNLLVILTDGDISDRQQCVDRIVEASIEPLSILILGIGPGTFENLEYLESGVDHKEASQQPPQGMRSRKPSQTQKNNEAQIKVNGATPNAHETSRTLSKLKDSKGKPGFRSIVRFVYYRNYKGKHRELEDALLRDLPKQMTEYYDTMQFQPTSDGNTPGERSPAPGKGRRGSNPNNLKLPGGLSPQSTSPNLLSPRAIDPKPVPTSLTPQDQSPSSRQPPPPQTNQKDQSTSPTTLPTSPPAQPTPPHPTSQLTTPPTTPPHQPTSPQPTTPTPTPSSPN